VIAMMKSVVLGALALTLAACATTPVTPGKATTANAATPPGCVGQTATMIPVKPGTCAGFGSTYTRDDIDKTGQTTLGPALRMLDPSIH
jgi:hypothetical protein